MFLDCDAIGSGSVTYLLFFIIYIPFLLFFLARKKTIFFHIVLIFFFIYLHMLFVLLFCPIPIDAVGVDSFRTDPVGPYYNIIPFDSIVYFITAAAKNHIEIIPAFKNLLGNIIAFMPFGFLFPCLNRRFLRLKNIVLLAFLVPLGVELTQLTGSLCMRVVWKFADIDDVSLNMAGMLLGFLILKLVLKVFNRHGIDLLKTIDA